jgi:hypothetical protein
LFCPERESLGFMKKMLFPLLALCTFLTSFSQAPSNGLVEIFDGLYVPFGVPVGNVTVAEDRNGQPCAIAFDGEPTSLILVQGVEQYSFHPDSSFSVSLWYQGGSEDAGDLETLFAKHGQGANPVWNPSYALELYDLNTPLMASPTANAWVDQQYITFPVDPEWHHLVGVFELGSWKIYFDNALRGSSQGADSYVAQMASDISIGENFEGKLDDIHLYNRSLSEAEVGLLFNASTVCVVGLPETDALDVTIYPNPSTGNLVIDLKEINADRIEIVDAQGRVVKSCPLFLQQNQIDLRDIQDGNYIIRFLERGHIIGQRTFMKTC